MKIEKEREQELILVDKEIISPVLYSIVFIVALVIVLLQIIRHPTPVAAPILWSLVPLGVLAKTILDVKKIRVVMDKTVRKVTVFRTGIFQQKKEEYAFADIKAFYIRWILYYYKSGTSYSLFLSNGKEILITLAPYYWRFSLSPHTETAERLGNFLNISVKKKGFWLSMRALFRNY